ncbi:toll/interleukin-1 receptor domain-containing protein [Streptomyces sp. LBL]|uniref:toll/interleukin-1 receptor domain-containing protein n=1 Tax=Streptomyces sp. LBL TaxID=2940562 RepID=UPI002474C923|nr:toll/interleukin-1 receptor domain-containing protein [Streptomyces sp. LBL]
MRTRLSYQQQDERPASSLAAALRRVGAAEVVLDAWRTGPDDSPASRSMANPSADTDDAVVLLWSAAAGTAWGEALAEPGLPSGLTGTGEARLVPVRLDDTPLPPSLGSLRHVRLAGGTYRMTDAAAAMIVHIGSTTVPAPAVRGNLSENVLVISDFGRLGLFATCPQCGVSSDRLRPYTTVEHISDRALRLVICGACDWQDACDI